MHSFKDLKNVFYSAHLIAVFFFFGIMSIYFFQKRTHNRQSLYKNVKRKNGFPVSKIHL